MTDLDALAKLYMSRPNCLQDIGESVLVELTYMTGELAIRYSFKELLEVTDDLENGVYGYDWPPMPGGDGQPVHG